MARAKKTHSGNLLKGSREGSGSKCAGCGGLIDVDGFEWVSLFCNGNNFLSHYGGNYSNSCSDSVMAEQREVSSAGSERGRVPNFEDL